MPMRSPKLITLAGLYDATEELLQGEQTELSQGAQIEKALAYWDAVTKVMPDWIKVKTGQITSLELRQERISSHTVVLRAIGAVGAELMRLPNWRERVADLGKIDWSKKHPDWQNICIVAGSVVSNRQSRQATKAYIKRELGLKLSEAEQRLLEGAHPTSPATINA
jgi:DNA sulfur modification protein DndB